MIRAVFFGSPDFAIPSLEKFHQDPNIELLQVYTQPPKPAGRGQKERTTDVNFYCAKNNLPVRMPKSLRREEELEFFSSLKPDVAIVVAYGLIIPGNFISVPKMGFLNLHPSDLPKYRGAAPLQWTLLNGEKESAICIMQIDEGMDSGDVLFREKFSVDNRDYQSLHDYCKIRGAEMLLEVINNYPDFKHTKQDHSKASFAPKITKEMALIEGKDTLETAINKSRALGSILSIIDNEENIKIAEIFPVAELIPGSEIGKLCKINNEVRFYLKDGYIKIGKLKKPGKNFVSAKEFVPTNNS